YLPELGPKDILQEHKHWAQCHETPLLATARPLTNDLNPDRPLRVAYVSPDFRRHPVANTVEPVLTRHDRARFHVTCYANVTRPDAITERMRGLADMWRDVVSLSDDQLAEQIRSDRIDILVDLAGHTLDHRLLAFARRPAPIQVAYSGYP